MGVIALVIINNLIDKRNRHKQAVASYQQPAEEADGQVFNQLLKLLRAILVE